MNEVERDAKNRSKNRRSFDKNRRPARKPQAAQKETK
jgi:hypothetical protein